MGRIEDFLNLYTKQNTKSVYRAGIYEFFDFVYGKVRKGRRVTREERKKYEDLADQYFNEDRNFFDDVIRFGVYLNEKPPYTAKSYLQAVKEFFVENGIEFSQKELKRIRFKLPKGNSQTEEKTFDHTTLRTILKHSDLKMRALILVLASSGMRVGELLQVRLDDLELDKDPPRINIRREYTKTGERRVTFITKEAKEALLEWLKVREDYLRASINKNKGLRGVVNAGEKSLEDQRVFPFDLRTVELAWQNTLKRAKLLTKDEKTNRVQYRIHGLRKFFRSRLPEKVPIDIVEALMGHSAYLSEAYRRYTEKQIEEHYLKGEHLLTIERSEDVEKIQKKTDELEKSLENNRKLIEDLILENRELKKIVSFYENALEKLAEMALKDGGALEEFKRLLKEKEERE